MAHWLSSSLCVFISSISLLRNLNFYHHFLIKIPSLNLLCNSSFIGVRFGGFQNLLMRFVSNELAAGRNEVSSTFYKFLPNYFRRLNLPPKTKHNQHNKQHTKEFTVKIEALVFLQHVEIFMSCRAIMMTNVFKLKHRII